MRADSHPCPPLPCDRRQGGELNREHTHAVVLRVRGNAVFLPLVTSFVELSAGAFGLGKKEALGLTLAAEEIFTHLCGIMGAKGGEVRVRCRTHGHYVRTDFSFPAMDFDVRAFNLTARVSPADDRCEDEMGLVLASRAVDRLHVTHARERGLRLTLIKEKAYPKTEWDVPLSSRPLQQFSIRPPEREELKVFALLTGKYYRRQDLPGFFDYPGKLVDMVGGAEYHALAALGPAGEIGGGILWCWAGSKTVEFYGPYVFEQEPHTRMRNALLDAAISTIARTPAVGLLNRCPPPDFPQDYFEPLGGIPLLSEDGTVLEQRAWFRLMHEDPGAVAWVHPELEKFIRGEFKRLVLPREVRMVRDEGETANAHSLLSADFDRPQKTVTLKPVWPGRDAGENVAGHVALLRCEGLRDVFFGLDLGQSWQAVFTPHVLVHGFVPRLLLPYAGEGDVVVFQLQV